MARRIPGPHQVQLARVLPEMGASGIGTAKARRCSFPMSKTTRALKKQAAKSQLVAQRATSPVVAGQMMTLADAFRAQAAVLKKNKKKK
jgi:hypothetical protein